MRRAVDAAPDASQSHFNLAVVLQARQRHQEAAASFERALALGGDDFDVHIGLGNVQLALGELASAEAHFRRALALDDRRVVAWSLLGAAVGRQRRYHEALELFAKADRIAAGDAEDSTDFTNFAIALSETGATARDSKSTNAICPGLPPSRPLRVRACAVGAGRLLEGWRHYEFRWLRHDAKTPKQAGLAGPVWSGQPLQGRTILIHVEQGFGDVIQFVRYATQVKALGATVLLRVARPMKNLLRDIAGVDRVLDRDEIIPAYDFYINLLSLPRIFGTSLDTIRSDLPYIHAEQCTHASLDHEASRRWRVENRAGVGGKSRSTRTIDFARWI